jgi:hypothetical protein
MVLPTEPKGLWPRVTQGLEPPIGRAPLANAPPDPPADAAEDIVDANGGCFRRNCRTMSPSCHRADPHRARLSGLAVPLPWGTCERPERLTSEKFPFGKGGQIEVLTELSQDHTRTPRLTSIL